MACEACEGLGEGAARGMGALGPESRKEKLFMVGFGGGCGSDGTRVCRYRCGRAFEAAEGSTAVLGGFGGF